MNEKNLFFERNKRTFGKKINILSIEEITARKVLIKLKIDFNDSKINKEKTQNIL